MKLDLATNLWGEAAKPGQAEVERIALGTEVDVRKCFSDCT